jgi:hypothetical protein
MNLLQMAQRLHRESGRSGIGPASLVDLSKEQQRLVDYIADAWTELQSRETDWRFMRKRKTATLVAGQSSYTAADLAITDFGRWRPQGDDYQPNLYGTTAPDNYVRLDFMPLDEWRENYVYSTQPAGRPLNWSVDDDDSLLIGPAPDAADTYSLRKEYKRTPTVLVENSSTPDIAPEFHMILVWRALIEVGKMDNAPDVLSRATANFARYEDNLLARYARPLHFGAALA